MAMVYRFAERCIGITSLYDDVHWLCAEYLVEDASMGDSVEAASGDVAAGSVKPDFSVETTRADIEFERERSAREDALEGIPVRQFSDGYLETLAIYRKIAEKMPVYDTILFHGSCVAVDGAAYLFTAKSGTGKSTHTRLWRDLLGNRAVMVNDDKPLIRLNADGTAIAYGTPWDGKHRLSANVAVPLKGICVLERAPINNIRPITFYEAYPMLLQQVYRPMNAAAMGKTLELVDRLAGAVALWRMGCNMDVEAARIAFEAMSERA